MAAFKGFDKEFVQFFKDLEENNSKDWFDANRKRYDQHIVGASRGFVEALTPRLQEFAPEIQGIPKANKSFGRINRDIRFSKDKTPYNTHWTMRFWEGEGKPKDSTGFTIWAGADKMMMAGGRHGLDKEQLTALRDAIVDPKTGKEFTRIISDLRKAGFDFWGEKYKRVPAGYDADHENAEFLKFNALGAYQEVEIPKEFYSDKIVEYVAGHMEKMGALHHWLVSVLG